MSAGDWWTINRDAAATRYSPLRQITARNVTGLTEMWTYTLGGNSTAVPIVVDGVMYVPSGDRVVALDGDSGEELWSYVLEPQADGAREAPARPPSVSNRGVGYWPGDADHAPRVLFMSGSLLHAVDASTGESATGFGAGGAVEIGVPYGGAPTLYRNVAIVGATVGEVPQGPPGNPRAFDVVSGEKLWEFQTVPQPGERFNDTWGDGWERRSGANMWAFAATVDARRGIVYLPISGPAANYWGGDRPGANVFANSIVAVDAETGAYRWHFQTVHHDLWDVDMPSAGGLFDFVRNGRRTPAIAHVGKSSYLFVLDRVTGEPLIEVEERPVPSGDVPGEWYAPTQPFPIRPEPLSRVAFEPERDLVRPEDTTAAHAAACREVMERSGGFRNEGPFTPFMYKAPDAPPRSTIQFPGGTGGVNWGGVAVDPATGYVFVNAHDTSLVGWIEDRDPEKNYGRGTAGSEQPYDRASIFGPGPYASFNAPLSGEFDENGRAVGPTLPCHRPPWSKLVAVDASKGEIVWESVLGINESLPPGRQRVGGSGSAGPTVTAGGLVFVGATTDQRFRAFDAATGEELWTAALESNANANPMTYLGASGLQRVAIVAGDRVVVYGVPRG
ncbi:MAG: PQQ-binding-like beta-propeller repeat protein [Gammaproteobacteria bacterium]|nr:PQQ-binding-like beta-propeller repeat protein [Gammaproteobacteria bacterium]